MPVFNILDQRRANEWNPGCDVVFEIFSDYDEETSTEVLHNTSIASAVHRAQETDRKVTMFIYDPGFVAHNIGFLVTIHPQLADT